METEKRDRELWKVLPVKPGVCGEGQNPISSPSRPQLQRVAELSCDL